MNKPMRCVNKIKEKRERIFGRYVRYKPQCGPMKFCEEEAKPLCFGLELRKVEVHAWENELKNGLYIIILKLNHIGFKSLYGF